MDDDIIHQHCLSCIKILKCNYRPEVGEPCNIIPCDLDCGARFHACKRQEHQLLCINEKVPCINAGNGCPSLLQRKFLGMHLKICPASAIYCTMEWNRWPIHNERSQLSREIHQRASHQTQLDVALAMRDQRMLWYKWKSSKDSPESFKNNFVKKSEQRSLKEERDAFWGAKKYPPHMEQEIYSELYKASLAASETLAAALSVISECNDMITIAGACARSGVSEAIARISERAHARQSQDENKENMMDCLNYNDIVNSPNKCKYDTDTISDHSHSLPMDFSPAGDFCVLPEDSSYKPCKESSTTNNEFDLEKVLEIFSDSDVVFANNTTVSEISSASVLDHALKDVISPVSSSLELPETSDYSMNLSPSSSSHITLGLDLNMESITRYKANPRSMYTFLCAQVFRRDEFAWHNKNVHGDIHSGLNGWLEERCPLAQYGCMFSRRRFYPVPQGSNIVHNINLESFGVKPPNSSQLDNTPCNCNLTLNQRCPNETRVKVCMDSKLVKDGLDSGLSDELNCVHYTETIPDGICEASINIIHLPFEILQHVARFLDSFSLCNLSLTSRLMRDVCRSLLEERGVVVFQWERQRKYDRYSWRVAHKKWFFSSSFTPITQWSFEDSNNMSNHLKGCAYFNRNLKHNPYYFPMGLEPSDSTYQKLKTTLK